MDGKCFIAVWVCRVRGILSVERPVYTDCAIPDRWTSELIVAPEPYNDIVRHSHAVVVGAFFNFNDIVRHIHAVVIGAFFNFTRR